MIASQSLSTHRPIAGLLHRNFAALFEFTWKLLRLFRTG